MKTLVIHPEDKSTDFLKPIYSQLNATVITGGLNKNEMMEYIDKHDRILMMGHGCSNGLIALNRFAVDENEHGEKLIIDNSFVSLLNKKQENIFIWCHANEFVEKHELKGFYTGMFISEEIEAMAYEVDATEEDIEFSNQHFSELISPIAHFGNQTIHNHLKMNYIIANNLVCEFNYERLFWR